MTRKDFIFIADILRDMFAQARTPDQLELAEKTYTQTVARLKSYAPSRNFDKFETRVKGKNNGS